MFQRFTSIITQISALGLLFTPLASASQSSPFWTGSSVPGYYSACLISNTNARLTPSLSEDNIRAIMREDSCGLVLHQNGGLVYEGRIPVHENGFYLLRFYVEELGEFRQYWIHESQLKNEL
jgi:hypothetical protein